MEVSSVGISSLAKYFVMQNEEFACIHVKPPTVPSYLGDAASEAFTAASGSHPQTSEQHSGGIKGCCRTKSGTGC